MQCILCGKELTIQRSFINLERKIDFKICHTCFQSKMNYYPYFVIPINGGLLHVFELLQENIDPIDSTLEYFRPFYQAYFKLSGKIDAIYMEYLTPKWIDLFDKLNIGHLIIFTNICKEE